MGGSLINLVVTKEITMQHVKNAIIFLLLISPAFLAPLEAAEPEVKTQHISVEPY